MGLVAIETVNLMSALDSSPKPVFQIALEIPGIPTVFHVTKTVGGNLR